jgi:tetratricopeptide (TPR) repeat protein
MRCVVLFAICALAAAGQGGRGEVLGTAGAVPREVSDTAQIAAWDQAGPQRVSGTAQGTGAGQADARDMSDAARAYEALRVRDYDLAIAAFRAAIGTAAGPSLGSLRKDLAYMYLKVGENELAMEQFREVMRLNPDDTQAALDYAFLCYENKRQAEARRIFDRIRKTGNAVAEQAFQNIDGALAAGIDRWKSAIEMGANDFSAHYELAALAEQRDDLPLAAEHYEKAWRALPDRRYVLVDLGRTWKAIGRSADATAALLAASRGGEPRAAELARELLPERYPYVDEFRRALGLDAGNMTLRRELAYLLLSMKRQAEAEAEFRIITEKAPDDLLAATQLAFLLHARGDDTAANPLFERVLKGGDPELANRVRAVLRIQQVPQETTPKEMALRSIKAGYFKDALRYLEAAHEADPADSEVLLKLGWTNNMLHRDSEAYHWFNLARQSSDASIAKDADRAWRGLRSEHQRFRATGWLYPIFSTRWHDLFSYAQFKAELRTGLGFRTYLSTRFVGDTRQTIGTVLPQYLSESSIILAMGLSAGPWHGFTAWAEAGSAYNYITHHMLPDYRGGISMARGVGHTLRGESAGPFADIAADGVFMSRFGNEVLSYNQLRIGYTAGPKAFRTQFYWAGNAVLDVRGESWANFGETGPGLRISGSFLPQSMYFTVDALRGRYFRDRAYFRDLRAGIWYAFTRY